MKMECENAAGGTVVAKATTEMAHHAGKLAHFHGLAITIAADLREAPADVANFAWRRFARVPRLTSFVTSPVLLAVVLKHKDERTSAALHATKVADINAAVKAAWLAFRGSA